MKIRKLKSVDAKQAAKLIRQLTFNIHEPKNLIKRLKGLAKGSHYQYYVVEHENKLLGFAGLAWYPIPSKGLIGWIEEVVVDEKSRNQGVGKLLMETLLKLAKQKKLIQIKLFTGNPAAKHIYEKFGFVKKNEDLFVKK